jgi:hypothetical protein
MLARLAGLANRRYHFSQRLGGIRLALSRVLALGLCKELGVDPHCMLPRRRVGEFVQNE